jgi:hypothetical protein
LSSTRTALACGAQTLKDAPRSIPPRASVHVQRAGQPHTRAHTHLNPKPPTLNPQPSTLQPSTLNPERTRHTPPAGSRLQPMSRPALALATSRESATMRHGNIARRTCRRAANVSGLVDCFATALLPEGNTDCYRGQHPGVLPNALLPRATPKGCCPR